MLSIEANRLNAKKLTGPRSAEGKAASSTRLSRAVLSVSHASSNDSWRPAKLPPPTPCHHANPLKTRHLPQQLASFRNLRLTPRRPSRPLRAVRCSRPIGNAPACYTKFFPVPIQ